MILVFMFILSLLFGLHQTHDLNCYLLLANVSAPHLGSVFFLIFGWLLLAEDLKGPDEYQHELSLVHIRAVKWNWIWETKQTKNETLFFFK